MTYRVAHRRPVSGSSQATEPAVRGQRFPQFVVYAIGGPDQSACNPDTVAPKLPRPRGAWATSPHFTSASLSIAFS